MHNLTVNIYNICILNANSMPTRKIDFEYKNEINQPNDCTSKLLEITF